MYLKRGVEMRQEVNRDDWIRSLYEVGFSHDMTVQIVSLVQDNDVDKATELLRRHKRGLLEELHNSENKVDLLDFLLYQLKDCQKQKGWNQNGKTKFNNRMG